MATATARNRHTIHLECEHREVFSSGGGAAIYRRRHRRGQALDEQRKREYIGYLGLRIEVGVAHSGTSIARQRDFRGTNLTNRAQ